MVTLGDFFKHRAELLNQKILTGKRACGSGRTLPPGEMLAVSAMKTAALVPERMARTTTTTDIVFRCVVFVRGRKNILVIFTECTLIEESDIVNGSFQI